ncbi:efflux RND transporter periplasmic adaptor subunit [Streptomyces sp. NPDC047028]|uniref:efflux RND transporter periplasmic adaptor subunit n=1 Tax=Streptomyces sp. NPDC047028 TaxID=3155793 RepID=UPI003401586D
MALSLAIAVGAVASLLSTTDKRSRLLFDVKPSDVSLTKTVTASLKPSGTYLLFFGRIVSLGQDSPSLADPCQWFPGRSDPANELGQVTNLSTKAGQHVTAGTVLAETNADQAHHSLDAANESLADARSALAADQTAAADLAGQLAKANAKAEQEQPQSSAAPTENVDRFEVNARIMESLQRVATAERQQQTAQKAVDNAAIKAPINGIVDSVNTAVGSTPSCRIPVITMHSDALSVSANVTSGLLTQLAPGQTAEVKVPETGDVATTAIDTVPSRVVTEEDDGKGGSSGSPSPSASTGKSRMQYPLTVSLDKPPGTFRPGMPAELTITLAQRTSVLSVPSAAIRHTADGSFVTVVKCHERGGKCRDAKKVTTSVRTGLVGDTMTEIAGGLNADDQVLLPSSAVKALQEAASSN